VRSVLRGETIISLGPETDVFLPIIKPSNYDEIQTTPWKFTFVGGSRSLELGRLLEKSECGFANGIWTIWSMASSRRPTTLLQTECVLQHGRDPGMVAHLRDRLGAALDHLLEGAG
jgi:hypothetical protein